MTPKMVIFDCDGVLVETESITNKVLSTQFTAWGAPIAEEEVHTLFSGGTMKTAGAEAAARGAVLPEGWMDTIYAQVFAGLRQGVMVFDGLFDLLDALDAAGVATAIASNGPMAKMEISLGPSGLWDRFGDRIYSGHVHGKPKPAPEMLWHAAERAGVSPADCVMIDDTTAGTRAADAAGMRAIGFAAASDADALIATGHPVAYTMAEVAALLGVQP